MEQNTENQIDPSARKSEFPFFVLAKPTGAVCNLQCRYCFYLGKDALYPGVSDFAMDDDVLETFIRGYIRAQPGNHVPFAWQGGEPTLRGLEFFRTVVNLQEKHGGGKTIQNAFQTNGVLLDDDWCGFFKDHNFLIGLSVDGPEEIHNHYRLDKGGHGSFKHVMRGLDYLIKHGVEFNTLTVVHKNNSRHPLDVYRFLKQIGSRFLQFIPVMEQTIGPDPDLPDLEEPVSLTEWSVGSEQYGRFLSAVFDAWVRGDVGRVYVQIFDEALAAWAGESPGVCMFQETCGRAPALEHNGDLYACDHYVFPAYRLGNIIDDEFDELVSGERQRAFGENKREQLPRMCRECDVRFICQGECPKNRILRTPDGEPGLNYYCQGYRYFFHHIAPFMRFMAGELQSRRAPANVIAWTKEKDRGFPNLKTGRNDPCPCGSGSKFKKCCGQNR